MEHGRFLRSFDIGPLHVRDHTFVTGRTPTLHRVCEMKTITIVLSYWISVWYSSQRFTPCWTEYRCFHADSLRSWLKLGYGFIFESP